jgi:hypothetical protein
MGFNKRKMDDARRQEAEKEAAARRAADRQIFDDADHLIAVWNERQAKFSPTVGAAITAGYWFLRALDWHRGAAVASVTQMATVTGSLMRSDDSV